MINLNFTVNEVDAILGALGEQPYVKVSEIINKIRSQAIPQWQAMQPSADEGDGVTGD